jgi:hypothetical protein
MPSKLVSWKYSLKRTLRYALYVPYVRRFLTRRSSYILERALGIPRRTFISFVCEFRKDRVFTDALHARITEGKKTEKHFGGFWDTIYLEATYAIVRWLKPNRVVETGVGAGSSTAAILKALHDNGGGLLWSIDLPGEDQRVYPRLNKIYHVHIPAGREPGWMIPDYLRDRWKLMIGPSQEKLPSLLQEIGPIDMFLHDSLHTDEHIHFELEQAWAKLVCGGVLLCDDVMEYWSLAFVDFCHERNIPYQILHAKLGIAQKREP